MHERFGLKNSIEVVTLNRPIVGPCQHARLGDPAAVAR